MITYLFQLQGLVFLSIYHPGNQRLVRKAYNKLQKLSAEDLTIYPKKMEEVIFLKDIRRILDK